MEGMKMENQISFDTVKQGQVAAYQDSIYEYVIESNLPEEFIKSFCTKTLRPATNESSSGCFSGCSGFPFGLSPFFKFKKTDDNIYLYTVCCPYCG
jgi:hypothetical protein